MTTEDAIAWHNHFYSCWNAKGLSSLANKHKDRVEELKKGAALTQAEELQDQIGMMAEINT